MKAWLSLALAVMVTAACCGDRGGPPDGRRPIDLVLCLDTSNSMDGLIDSAKAKLWDIVTELSRCRPTPRLRVALYSYGNDDYDPRKGWVRKETDLTTDLDLVSEKLFGLRTYGGTEYVGRVGHTALRDLEWQRSERTFRVMFVCGNEPADQDPEIRLSQLAEDARRLGVVINTIYCGSPEAAEAQGWRRLADLADGKFMAINQDRGRRVVTTPHDRRLTELGTRLNQTYLFYGKDGAAKRENQRRQDENAATLSGPGGTGGAAAGRSAAKASDAYRMAEHDLVDRRLEDPKFDVTKVPESELPEEMRRMTPEQRRQHLEAKVRERQQLQDEIRKLSRAREEYLAAERKKSGRSEDKALDEAIREVVREQAGKRGFQIGD